MKHQVIFATSNEHKVKEVREIFRQVLDIEILSLNDVHLQIDQEETGVTFEDNAAIKASNIANKTDIPVFADDSGLSIVSLNNFPGVHSARFMEGHSYIEKNQAILKMMENIIDRQAFFTSAVVYINKNLDIRKTFIGVAKGEIIKSFDETAKGGFGYDPIFYSYDLEKTFGHSTDDEKNKVSHRGKAFAQLIAFLKEIYK